MRGDQKILYPDNSDVRYQEQTRLNPARSKKFQH